MQPDRDHHLPAGHAARVPTLADDVEVHRVLAACELEELGEVEVDLEDIRSDWRRPGVDVAADGVFVVGADGGVVGYGEVISGRAEGNVLPAHRGRGIGTWLAAWIESRARQAGSSFVRQVVPATATPSLDLLAAAGYERSDTAWELELQLDHVGERPALPDGIEFRDFRPGADDEAAFRVIEDAFAPWPNREPNTLDGWRAVTVERAGFEPWMLPLAWSGERVVGAAYCIDYPDDAFVWIQQLAVAEAERGRGLGTQLLHESFGRFRGRGRTTAGLSTDSRTGALGLYLRVGMSVKREFIGHVLRLDG